MNNLEYIGPTFDYMIESGYTNDMYIIIYGRVTKAQRGITRKRLNIDMQTYICILKQMIDNHPLYKTMEVPENFPQPGPIGEFSENKNNTYESD